MGLETTEIISLANGGLTKYWGERGKILVYTFYDNQRETIDGWSEDVFMRLQNVVPNTSIFLLYDISRIFITPYMRERIEAIGINKPSNIKNYFAIIVPHNTSGEMVKKYLSQDFEQGFALELQFFHDFPSAVNWLRERLTKEEI